MYEQYYRQLGLYYPISICQRQFYKERILVTECAPFGISCHLEMFGLTTYNDEIQMIWKYLSAGLALVTFPLN